MDFYIKKFSTLPILKLGVAKDGRSDYNNFMELLETSTIFFSMVNSDNGTLKITSKPAGFVEKTFDDPNAEPEYYIYYQFTNTDTNTVGKFEGQFLVKNTDGNLILPIREKLFIYVQESFIADDLEYDNCYTSVYPCCVVPILPSVTPTPTPTNTPTPTPTPTSIPEPLQLVLLTEYTPGSIIATYTLILNRPYTEEITVSFENVLNVYSGDPITIFATVTVNLGDETGQTIVPIDEDYNNFNGEEYFSQLFGIPPGSTYEIIVIPPIPAPTPTPTPTPTNPCVEYITDENGDIITDENGNPIISEINPCITPTPTNTQTPTPTPTPTP